MAHEATIRGVGVSVGSEGMGAPAVILDVRDVVVPIFVDGGQAQAIERARQGVPAERPMTHDLFVGVLDETGATLDRVRIDDLSDGTFYAKFDLLVDRDDGEEKVVRDARPSDAIALAVRVDCPILVAADVIDAAGQPPEALGLDGAGQHPAGSDQAGFDIDVGGERSGAEFGSGEDDPDADELDDAVEIDLEETDESAEDDDPTSGGN